MSRFPLRPAFVLLAALASCVVAACSPGVAAPAVEPAKPAGAAVEVARVVRGELTARYTGTAALEAEREARLVSEVAGSVVQILVEEGDRVRKGQVLARLDADRSRLQLREAEADLQRRRNDVERSGKLLARQLVGVSAHEQAESDLATRNAEVGLARVSVGKAEIRAPFDGIVTRRWVKQGQLLALAAPVFDLADFSDLRAQLRVPERDVVALARGQQVELRADALPGRRFAARIERIAPVVDRASGTVSVVVAADNREGLLRPGLFCRLDIAYRHVDDALLLPKAAVLGNADDTSVYVVDAGHARRTRVRLGHETAGQVEVLDGLAADAEVVVAGQSALSDGAAVEVLPTRAIASAPSVAATAAPRR